MIKYGVLHSFPHTRNSFRQASERLKLKSTFMPAVARKIAIRVVTTIRKPTAQVMAIIFHIMGRGANVTYAQTKRESAFRP